MDLLTSCIRRNTNLKKWNWCTCDKYLARKLNGKCHLVAIHWTTVPVLYCKVKSLDSFEYRAPADFTTMCPIFTLRWNHNERNGVSNHQPHDCLLNRLFRRRSKKTSKLRVPGLCDGNSPGPVNSPHKGPVTWKMFPFDDVIIWLISYSCESSLIIPATTGCFHGLAATHILKEHFTGVIIHTIILLLVTHETQQLQI